MIISESIQRQLILMNIIKPEEMDTLVCGIKPRTMISKVAEMHALRMACPEELAQSYVEEEVEAEIAKPLISIDENKTKLEAVKDLAELKVVWSSLPVEAKEALKEIKDNLKKKYENSKI